MYTHTSAPQTFETLWLYRYTTSEFKNTSALCVWWGLAQSVSRTGGDLYTYKARTGSLAQLQNKCLEFIMAQDSGDVHQAEKCGQGQALVSRQSRTSLLPGLCSSMELPLKRSFPFWKRNCFPPFRGTAQLGHPQSI